MEDTGRGRRTGTARASLGRDTKGFFSDVVSGLRDVPDTRAFRPEILHDEIFTAEEWFEAVNPGEFDAHIVCSIPTYFEMVRVVAAAIVLHSRAFALSRLVDLGASEGTFCAAIYHGSRDTLQCFAVEPNPDMVKKIDEQPGCVTPIIEALDTVDGKVVFDEGVGEIDVYDFQMRADYYTELMTFQFLGPEREHYVSRIAADTSSRGVFVTCEKFGHDDFERYKNLEEIKDAFKMRFFDERTILRKASEVLSRPSGGMNSGMVTTVEYEVILKRNFPYVACFWDSCNFRGYAASHDKKSLLGFLNFMPSLQSRYSTVPTPYIVP